MSDGIGSEWPDALRFAGMTALPEHQRQAQFDELDELGMDAFAETAFDDLVTLAASTFDVPMAAISIVEGDRQWFKAKVGFEVTETPRGWAFCDYTIHTPAEFLVVEDATQDDRFAANPLVTGEPGLRFYAASPLRRSSGYAIGVLCVMDTHPRHADPAKMEHLRFMAHQVVSTLEKRRAAQTATSVDAMPPPKAR